MTMFDLALTGGDVWQPDVGVTRVNIYVTEERIALISPADLPARNRIDITGKVVLPGLIDTHSHHRDPGFTHKEDVESATRAAAAGGVTTTFAMPNVNPPTADVDTLREQMRNYQTHAIVDWNINPSASDPAMVQPMAELGIAAYKVYMVVDSRRPYPHMPALGIHNHAHILEIMEAVKETGLPLMVHPNDQSIFQLQERRHFEQEIVDPTGYGKQDWMFDSLAWSSGVATLVEINHVVGGKLHLCHMMSDRTVTHVRRAKEDGDDVTSEVNAFALFQHDPALGSSLGPFALGRFLKPAWVEALWNGIADGTVDVLGTDHAPHTAEEKMVGWDDMWKAPSGTPALQHYLVKLIDASHDGRITLDDIVRITSWTPARRFGLYPKKGTIESGADADLVIVDLNAEHTISNDDVLSKCGWTPFDGQKVRGRVEMTILRGTIVARDGKVDAVPGTGRMATPVHG
jgi:dihydroorotase